MNFGTKWTTTPNPLLAKAEPFADATFMSWHNLLPFSLVFVQSTKQMLLALFDLISTLSQLLLSVLQVWNSNFVYIHKIQLHWSEDCWKYVFCRPTFSVKWRFRWINKSQISTHFWKYINFSGNVCFCKTIERRS